MHKKGQRNRRFAQKFTLSSERVTFRGLIWFQNEPIVIAFETTIFFFYEFLFFIFVLVDFLVTRGK